MQGQQAGKDAVHVSVHDRRADAVRHTRDRAGCISSDAWNLLLEHVRVARETACCQLYVMVEAYP